MAMRGQPEVVAVGIEPFADDPFAPAGFAAACSLFRARNVVASGDGLTGSSALMAQVGTWACWRWLSMGPGGYFADRSGWRRSGCASRLVPLRMAPPMPVATLQ